MKRNKLMKVLLLALSIAALLSVGCFAAEVGESFAYNTLWAALPPIIAIGLALITKEVYSSLFLGIAVGAAMFANFNFMGTITHIFDDGIIMNLSDSWNVGILVFDVLLGFIVQLINAAGGSAAFGRWAKTHIKSRVGAQLATFALGVLIFVDDYFNCLTVGSVMRPVADGHNISRAKLAYLIDATAAPVCMIAPISSWAAAVSGVVEGMNGLELFIKAIPYNFYSLLTLTMIIAISLMKFDFGSMRIHETNAREKGDIFTVAERPFGENSDAEANPNGRVIDLVLPVIVLIISCVVGMIYTGGFFEGTSFIDAFAGCDAAYGLALGSVVSLVIIFVYYMLRRTLTFKQFAAAVPEGFRSMVPAILILTFAWGIKSMTGLLGADVYVSGIVESSKGLIHLLPAIVFVVAAFLAFSTGTSWGTFGILLPIVTGVLDPTSELMIITVSACLAGAVCGDHCSPISDTTIMASSGAQCDHVAHVSTQLPYAILVAVVSAVFYLVAGFVQSVIVLPIAMAAMVAVLFAIRAITNKKAA